MEYKDFFEIMQHNYMKCPYDYPFDLTQKPDRFGYFEVLIGKDGIVYEAPNGHQRGLVMMIARDQNITPNEVDDKADVVYYHEWLLKESGALMVWHKFYTGTPNEKQEQTLNMLKERGFLSKRATYRIPAY